jgi:hypothetical protein
MHAHMHAMQRNTMAHNAMQRNGCTLTLTLVRTHVHAAHTLTLTLVRTLACSCTHASTHANVEVARADPQDPVRAEVPDAVAVCKRAGILVRMVTGEHVRMHAHTRTHAARSLRGPHGDR